MSMLNNVDVVGYWAYIRGTYIWRAYIRVGLYISVLLLFASSPGCIFLNDL